MGKEPTSTDRIPVYEIRLGDESNRLIAVYFDKEMADKVNAFFNDRPQKPVDKDWEILEYWCDTIGSGVGCVLGKSVEAEYSHGMIGLTILKVKRLSDGEYLSIGDNSNFGRICGFKIEGDKMKVLYAAVGDWQWISSIRKEKSNPPGLFKTEDGVDVFEGGKFFFVHEGNWFISGEIVAFGNEPVKVWKNEDIKTFSTKEAAQEYVLMNKPCLSVNDALKTFYLSKGPNEEFSNDIKELAKDKIK